MNNILIKIFFATISILCIGLATSAQTIKNNGKHVKLDSNTLRKVEMLYDSLPGNWELIKTIRYENGDTIIQTPSLQTWADPGSKPRTTIVIDTLKNFKISQICMKCPYLMDKTGKYEIEIQPLDGLDFFYINFIDTRQKKYKKNMILTADFNGYLFGFESGEICLRNKAGEDWIYKRVLK